MIRPAGAWTAAVEPSSLSMYRYYCTEHICIHTYMHIYMDTCWAMTLTFWTKPLCITVPIAGEWLVHRKGSYAAFGRSG